MIGDFKFYEVGGKIRDELLGLTNKDVDYVAVPTDELFKHGYTAEQMFTILLDYLHSKKFEVFLVTEDCYTIRAKFPEGYKYQGVADFVMARKEVGYIPGTRSPIVNQVIYMMIYHVEILLLMQWLKTLILEKSLITLMERET